MTNKRITEWIFFADSDISSAKVLLEEEIFHTVCFHAQQAVEKILKAYLITQQINPPKIHSIKELFERSIVSFPELSDFRDQIISLDRFYIPTRYPDALPGSLPEGLPDKSDAEKAVMDASEIVSFVKNKLNI